MVGVDDITIRPAADADLPAVALLRWQWDVDDNGAKAALTREEFVARFVDWANANASTHRCAVVLRDERVVGMGWLAVTERVPSPSSPVRRTGDVQRVYVSPDERGSGLGSRVIEQLVELADELGLERVTVHSSRRAIPAYNRHGFVPSVHLLQRA